MFDGRAHKQDTFVHKFFTINGDEKIVRILKFLFNKQQVRINNAIFQMLIHPVTTNKYQNDTKI